MVTGVDEFSETVALDKVPMVSAGVAVTVSDSVVEDDVTPSPLA